MTIFYPATTRRPNTSGPARTPLWWTQPSCFTATSSNTKTKAWWWPSRWHP